MFSLLIFLIIFTNGVTNLVAQARPSSAPTSAFEKYFTDISLQQAAAPSALANPKQAYGSCNVVNNVERCETRCDEFRVIFSTRGCDRCYCDSPFSRYCDLSNCMEPAAKSQSIEELQKEYQKDPKNLDCKLVQVESKLYSLCPYESRKPDVYPQMVEISPFHAPDIDSRRLVGYYQAPVLTKIAKHIF